MWRLPPIGTGVDPVPAILIATFGNLVLIGAVAPWLARRIWKRRPAAEPGAPPRAQLEVLTDRIGTGLLLATVVGVIAAGLAAQAARGRGDRGARAQRPRRFSATSSLTGRRSCGATSTRQTRRRLADGLLPHLHPARRPRVAGPASSWTRASPDAGDRGPERDPEPDPLAALRRAGAPPAGSTSNTSTWLRPARSDRLRHHHREVLAALPPQVEAAPDRADPPVHRHRHVAVLAERHSAQRPGHARGQHACRPASRCCTSRRIGDSRR